MRRYKPNCWQTVAMQMKLEPTTSRRTWNKSDMPHPREAGARPSASLLVGQLADYRFGPETGASGVHVQEYADHWVAWLDNCQEATNPFAGIASSDSDAAMWLSCGLAGAAAGGSASKPGASTCQPSAPKGLVAVRCREHSSYGTSAIRTPCGISAATRSRSAGCVQSFQPPRLPLLPMHPALARRRALKPDRHRPAPGDEAGRWRDCLPP